MNRQKKATDELLAKQAHMMKERGWIMHYVLYPPFPSGEWVNCHTHGLQTRFGHLDFQLVYPIGLETANKIMDLLVEQVEAGMKFAPGDQATEIIKRFPVTFVAAVEGSNQVLRIIFPDRDGNLEGDFARKQIEVRFEDDPDNENRLTKAAPNLN
jgi:hypothetical protein